MSNEQEFIINQANTIDELIELNEVKDSVIEAYRHYKQVTESYIETLVASNTSAQLLIQQLKDELNGNKA